MKCIICTFVQLNIFCLICINRQYPQNCIEFDNEAWVCSIFILMYNIIHSFKCSKTRTIPGVDHIWLVQTKFNMSAERMLKRRKHFSQMVRPMISVAVSKLGKTDLVFVQPGAKINSVTVKMYSNKVYFRQFAVSRDSNNDFLLKQDGTPCTPFTTLSFTCIPMCLSSLNQKTGRRTVQI